MLSLFDLTAILLVLTAGLAWFNHRFVKLPRNIGMLVMSLIASLLLVGLELAIPRTRIFANVSQTISQIDFHAALMHGMLGFLLFAGALHVDLGKLKSRALSVALMASVGVLISTVLFGAGFYGVARLLGIDLPFIWALVFGALISPTDPVAVLSTLKEVKVHESLETDMAGESLFNDGVGVVLFTLLLAIATQGSGAAVAEAGAHEANGFWSAVRLFLLEAAGGALLGLAGGYLAYFAMRSIDEYVTEVLISIALVMGLYAFAFSIHASGPIAVVIAGLLIGERGPGDAMSDVTQQYLFGFWTLIDEMLNAILFMLIGLELLIIKFLPVYAWAGLAAIALVLMVRFASVAGPVLALRPFHSFERGTIAVLTWGGLRGGISVALALSLPASPQRDVILMSTYAVVLFSIIVQGLTLKRVVQACVVSPGADASDAKDGSR